MKDVTLLLTGCINPNGMSVTYLQDCNERKRQYIDALRYYLSKTNCYIVFAENSNEDISSLFISEIDSGRLECITFDGNTYDKKRGKGYGEALIIQKALNTSSLIKKSSCVIKITGRLISVY